MELRVIKKTEIKGNGEEKHTWIIQRKFMFMFWINYGITTHYYTHVDWNDRPSHGAMLTKRVFLFDNENKAFDYLSKIQHGFKEMYKGNEIIRVFNDNTWEDVFINKSNFRYWNNCFCYEYSNSLNGLKEKIDSRVHNTKTSIVRR